MNKKNLDNIMREYYYERNEIEDTIGFLYSMANLYQNLLEEIKGDK